jgi:hypothetical protein
MQVLMIYLVDSVKKHSTVSSVFQSLVLFWKWQLYDHQTCCGH